MEMVYSDAGARQVSGLLSVLNMANEVQILLLLRTKRLEILVTCLPLGTLHGYTQLCEDCASPLQYKLASASLVVCVVIMALSGLEQDIFRCLLQAQDCPKP